MENVWVLTSFISYLELNIHNSSPTTQNKLLRPGLVTDTQVKLHQLHLCVFRNTQNRIVFLTNIEIW